MTWLSDDAVRRLRDVASRPALPADRYVLDRPIGRGGMGVVYAATDVMLQRRVAIKVSSAVAATDDVDARLRREAHVLAALEHPGIVPLHDAGVLPDGRWFYVMKLVDGETLAQAALDRSTEARALAIFERIADAVSFAHARGVVHRDLKPSNVMIGRFGEVLVLDWGVARILSTPGRAARDSSQGPTGHPAPASGPIGGQTESHVAMGTPGFMAPEQAADAATVGPAADVYSLGVLLWWLLTGEVPPPAPLPSAPRPLTTATRLPKRLVSIVRKCLSPVPSDRYADASGLAADLARYRAREAVAAHPETLLDRLGRALETYKAAVWLVAAYLVMRTLFAFWARPSP